MTSCNQTATNAATTTVTSSSSANDLKVAYINNDSLWMYYEYIDVITADFRAKQTQAQKRLQNRGLKLQGEMENFQKRYQAGLMSKNEAKRGEATLLKAQEDFETSRQAQAQGLAAEEQNINKEIYARITDYLEEYNKEKGYKIVLGYTKGSNIWLADKSMDITQDIVDGLNAKYNADKDGADKTDDTTSK